MSSCFGYLVDFSKPSLEVQGTLGAKSSAFSSLTYSSLFHKPCCQTLLYKEETEVYVTSPLVIGDMTGPIQLRHWCLMTSQLSGGQQPILAYCYSMFEFVTAVSLVEVC
jgi:hypothetical protein